MVCPLHLCSSQNVLSWKVPTRIIISKHLLYRLPLGITWRKILSLVTGILGCCYWLRPSVSPIPPHTSPFAGRSFVDTPLLLTSSPCIPLPYGKWWTSKHIRKQPVYWAGTTTGYFVRFWGKTLIFEYIWKIFEWSWGLMVLSQLKFKIRSQKPTAQLSHAPASEAL